MSNKTVELLKKNKVFKGTDNFGDWIFRAFFGQKSNHVTFAFGQIGWLDYGAESKSQVMMVLIEHPDYDRHQYFFAHNDDLGDGDGNPNIIKSMDDFMSYGDILNDYWDNFFSEFAQIDHSTLRTGYSALSEEAQDKFLEDRDCEWETWMETHLLDRFLHTLKIDAKEGAIVFPTPQLKNLQSWGDDTVFEDEDQLFSVVRDFATPEHLEQKVSVNADALNTPNRFSGW